MNIRYCEMESVNDMMEAFKKAFRFKTTLKQHTLFKFWSKIVSKKFKDLSKPVSVNSNGILQVACKNSLVTSELFMFKDDILKKTEVYSKPLGFEIADIIFSHKIWTQEPESVEAETTTENPKISDEELQKIELDEQTINEIQSAVENSSFAAETDKQKMFSAIIKNLKVQIALKMQP